MATALALGDNDSKSSSTSHVPLSPKLRFTVAEEGPRGRPHLEPPPAKLQRRKHRPAES